jgi:phosphatidylglycerol:prolipoprotein diacylglycerol transferase
LFFVQKDVRKAGIDANIIADLAFWVLLIGLAGSRFLHIVMFSDEYSWSDPIGWIAVWRGGLVFQGGPPPAILFAYWYLRRKKISFWTTIDVAFPYLALGHAFGRIGCFLNGCCYGLPTTLPWGVRFPRVPFDVTKEATGSPAFLDHVNRFSKLSMNDQWSLPIHPTQLYEFFALIGICLLLLALRKYWHPFVGFTMPVYFILYGLWRFFNESLRGDHNPTRILSFTDQQVFSLIFAVLSVILFFVLKHFQTNKGNVKAT